MCVFMTKICITSTGPTLDSRVNPRFGRCEFFIIVDPDTYIFEAVTNVAATSSGGAGVRASQTVSSMNVEAVLTGSVGPNAFPALQDAGIRIFVGISGTVKNVIDGFKENNYQELTSPGQSHQGINHHVDSTY